MAHRPYPDRGRALRQIMRRHRNEVPPELLPHQRIPEVGAAVGEYRISTRAR
ncbi:hypothetical protein [Streptomyces sp. NPDC053367]|uniref:hypothetical protein n=1 Tax=Streptomyces sp. NPDC053367 TaxID=3365700 RepID=UPI0037D197FA